MTQPPERAQVEAELERIVQTQLSGSPQLARFVRYVVAETLAGRADKLKEYTVGVNALGCPPGFDPSSDARVRVAARQLRFKLADYYAGPGLNSPIAIDLPKGTYIPSFTHRMSAPGEPSDASIRTQPSAPRRTASHFRIGAGLGLASVAALLIAMKLGGGRPASAADAARAEARAGLPSIAVLPLRNLTGSHDDDYLADGLTEEVTTALASVSGLRVIARTSAFRYRDAHADVRDVGRALGAAQILEGSVQRDRDSVRVTVRLIDTSDGSLLWGRRYQLGAARLFATNDVIARAVRDAIAARVDVPLQALATRVGTENADAYALFLRAREAWNRRTVDGYTRAIALYEQALRIDSLYAQAWAGLATVYATMSVNSVLAPGVGPPKAIAAAQRALAVDPSSGEAHAALALMRAFGSWDWSGADSGFARAIALSPNYPTARSWYAITLVARGRFDEALAHLRDAQLLDPLSLPIAYNIGEALYYARRFDEALAQTDRMVQLDSTYVWSWPLRGSILLASGRLSEAHAAFVHAGDSLGMSLTAANRSAAAVQHQIAALPESRQVNEPYSVAIAYALSGSREKALEHLERALAVHQLNLVSLAVDPAFDSLRDEPRFKRLRERLRL